MQAATETIVIQESRLAKAEAQLSRRQKVLAWMHRDSSFADSLRWSHLMWK